MLDQVLELQLRQCTITERLEAALTIIAQYLAALADDDKKQMSSLASQARDISVSVGGTHVADMDVEGDLSGNIAGRDVTE